jgi:glycerol-3-phosphate dehydrogenase
MKTVDVIIIGGGVVGCMTARALSRYQLNVLLIEKESDIGMGATSANSAIVHAGYDPVPGTLKAQMNVAGNAMWDTLSGELGFDFERRGDYVVAIGKEELAPLEALQNQGRNNGVPGMHFVPADEMRLREPNLSPEVSGALWAPTGGICDPFMATVAAAENAVHNGVTVLTGACFENFIFADRHEDSISDDQCDDPAFKGSRIIGVKTSRGDFGCRWVINAAGLHADTVMHKAGVRPEFKITPRRGEYSVLDRAEIQVNNVLFPVPSDKGKGILVTTTVHGNTIVGPNSQYVDNKEDRPTTGEGMAEIWSGAQKLIPSLTPRFSIAVFAGLRACGNAPCLTPGVHHGRDFIIEISPEVKGLVNLGGIESPGLTSAPAIAQRVVDLLKDAGEKLVAKPDWNPIRAPRPHFRHLPREEQIKLIKADPRYGRVICRCELVTEGEIIAEIHAPIAAVTYDAIKRRTWLGTGRCLGSFDMPRVVDIIAHELGVPPEAVSKKGPGSEFLVRRTKDWEVEA